MNDQTDKIKELAKKLEEIEQFIAKNRKAFQSQPIVQVTGAWNPQPTKAIPISLSQLIKIYNDVPLVLLEYAKKVNLTQESYRQPAQKSLILTEATRANYWIIATEQNSKLQYWLFPNGNITIPLHHVTSIRNLFQLRGQEPNQTSEYIVEEPATVSLLSDGKQWKLEKPGILYIGRTNRDSKESNIKLKEKLVDNSNSPLIGEEVINLLNQVNREMQQIKEDIIELFQETTELESKISLLEEENIFNNSPDSQPKTKPIAKKLTRFNYVGLWLRLLAIVIDSVIIAAAIIVVNFFLYLDAITITIIFLIATWLYMALTESSESQGTIGKQALGIKVIDLQGQKISFGKATVRYIGKIIFSFLFFFIILNQKKQGLHDIIAATLVVKQ